MKQYCRYCQHLHATNGVWCDKKEKEVSESTAKSTNNCKLFEFNPIDAFAETDGYKPKIKQQPLQDDISDLQIVMENI